MKRVFAIVAVVIGTTICPTLNAQDPQKEPSEQAKRDQLRIAVQQICPISGNKLGEHGAPVKVKVGEEEVFLCCTGCLQGKVDPKHWATIHANFAEAQAICPVMKHAIPENPKWTIVEGRIVYVCCPPCIEKIKADPETYLKLVDKSYAAFLEKKTVPR